MFMGFLHAKKVTTYIFGKDRITGKIIHSEQFSEMGSISGQVFSIEDRLKYLSQMRPDLQWEYEIWKD
jgi:hypothetical protein